MDQAQELEIRRESMAVQSKALQARLTQISSDYALTIRNQRRMEQSLSADHARVLEPDYRTPFTGQVDAWHRLIPYHVFYVQDSDSDGDVSADTSANASAVNSAGVSAAAASNAADRDADAPAAKRRKLAEDYASVFSKLENRLVQVVARLDTGPGAAVDRWVVQVAAEEATRTLGSR